MYIVIVYIYIYVYIRIMYIYYSFQDKKAIKLLLCMQIHNVTCVMIFDIIFQINNKLLHLGTTLLKIKN